MKSKGSHATVRRRIKHAIYIATAIVVAALTFYLNLRRENTLLRIEEGRALVQETFDADSRFRNITTGIDKERMLSVITGSVANQEDLRELNRKISALPPFYGTYAWEIDVEIKAPRTP